MCIWSSRMCYKRVIAAVVATNTSSNRLASALPNESKRSILLTRSVNERNLQYSTVSSSTSQKEKQGMRSNSLSAASSQKQSQTEPRLLHGSRGFSSRFKHSVKTSRVCLRHLYTHTGSNHVPWRLKESVPDLQRFLSEIGTDPREARYWLKQFLNVDKTKPFAVVEVDPEIFEEPQQLENLASAVSFLQRNSLRLVLVFGPPASCQAATLQALKARSTAQSCMLSDALKAQGLEVCILFPGSGVIELEQDSKGSRVTQVQTELLEWCALRHTVPIIPSFGETSDGRTVPLHAWHVTSAVSRQLQPLKIIKVNGHGGFQDDRRQVIANVNLPLEFQAAEEMKWCTDSVLKTIEEVRCLLSQMPEQTSVVITAADKVLQELFTHHGSGTFLKMREPILKLKSFDELDVEKLEKLLTKAFRKQLISSYFEEVHNDVHTIYLCERYTAAAIILKEGKSGIPYLCKFVVSVLAQGEGTGDLLWDAIRRDFSQLFWRSRGSNPINPWYFKKCEGSWSNNKWSVFWYGVPDPSMTCGLIHTALSLPDSFHVPAPNTAARST